MAKITYDFYTEKDADAVAELMRNNKFWVGKFNKNLSGENFIDYQRKKGTILAIVGKKDGKVVSYVASYQTGGQKVANPNQAFICALIIDSKYRMSMFSISDMFSMLMKELIQRGYNDLICEVAKENFPSFYMMRKCGFVIIDENRTLYGDYVLHNYLPGIIRLADRMDFADSEVLPEIMQKLDKKNLYKAEPILYKRFIQIECKAHKNIYKIFVDTISGIIAGVDLTDHQFRLWPKDGDLRTYTFENYGEQTRRVEVKFFAGDAVTETHISDDRKQEIEVPESADKISFKVEGDPDTYTFFIREMIQQGKYHLEKSYLPINDYQIEEKSAFLTATCEQQPMFREMWPHAAAPYIEGIFIPNYEKGVVFKRTGTGVIAATQTTTDYILTREYRSVHNKLEIRTKVTMRSSKKCQPMFQFALDDLSYHCKITLKDKTQVERIYDPEDGECVTEEMIFLNFLGHEYTKKPFQTIDLSFDCAPNTIYRIRTSNPATCFCQLNYLGIEYSQKLYKGKKTVDFGVLSIEKLTNQD